jgi:hypothetical protein
MNNSTELDLPDEQLVEAVAESVDITLSAIELDLVGGGGPISVFY